MSKKDRIHNDQTRKTGRLKHKYRFSVYNDSSYKQIWHIRLSGFEALILGGSTIIAIIALVTVTIAFTPLRELIPGYPDDKTRRDIVQNALRADSLEMMMYRWELQLDNLNRIISGEDPMPVEHLSDSIVFSKAVISHRSKEDSLLRLDVERQLQESAADPKKKKDRQIALQGLNFFTPVKGVTTDHFDIKNGHTAIDIAATANTPILSTLDGTVVLAVWTKETGNTIQIQHRNNLISVYKHCAKLLKKQGDSVKAGEVIALVGNTGRLSTGYHLHFELWYAGTPVDPEQYISF